MTAHHFNLRGIDSNVMTILKRQAEKQRTSVNQLIIKYIEQCVGHGQPVCKPVFHDLDHLAGTWKHEDAKSFEKNTAYFEKIDKDSW